MLLKDFISRTRETLSTLYPQQEAGAQTTLLCGEVLGVKPYTHIVEPAREVDADLLPVLEAMVERLSAGEPLQYVLGTAGFYGRNFKVSPAVLIPRPETELLCRNAILAAGIIQRRRSAFSGSAPVVRILDLCTGSGCIAWTMALEVPLSEVTAVDISADALAVARSQSFAEDCKPVKFIQCDILDDDSVRSAIPDGMLFDVVLSNPPYVLEKERAQMKANVLEHEPGLALFVPDDDFGKFYKKIAEIAFTRMHTDAVGFVEINEAFGEPTAAIFEASGFRLVKIIKDISGRNRIVEFRK